MDGSSVRSTYYHGSLTAPGPPDRVDSELAEAEVNVVEKDRRNEDEWFIANEKKLLEAARLEREKREKARAAETAESDRKRLREQHFMRCPKCGHEMKEETLEGVAIDRCSHCEGIYFDAGELEQLYLRRQEDRRSFFRKLVRI
jgi:uncharacterized protein with PIN domain